MKRKQEERRNKIQTKEFIRDRFAEYYQRPESIKLPSSLERREFAFLLLEGGIMRRHEGFRNAEEVRVALRKLVPAHVYYSTAVYENPEREMDAKGWLGADLFFDIDVDHIPTPCEKKHDTWCCTNCREKGVGAPPENCPKCGEQKFDDATWACEVCLESGKKEAIKLIDILKADFGLSSDEIEVAFSGHRGYHVTIEDPIIQKLDQSARREIVDYVIGVGFEPKAHGLERASIPSSGEHGWRGRIAEGIFDFLQNANVGKLRELGFKKKSAETIINEKDNLLKNRKNRKELRIQGINSQEWEIMLRKVIENRAVKIDTVVTPDIHRLIRLADTLHGKTGLKKVIVPISDIDSFDPLKSAVAFKGGSIRLLVSEAPEFRLGDDRYGPFKDAEVELSTAAALFLLCKRAAKLKETN